MAEQLVSFDEDRTVPCRQPGTDPDLWYPKPGQAGVAARTVAVALCNKCPRREECLARALGLGEVGFGVWAALTPPERADLLRAANKPPSRQPEKPRPAAPPRSRTRFAGWNNPYPPSPEAIRNVFDAARAILDGDGTRVVIAARFGVSEPRMAQAASILRYCPDLEGNVVDGWMPFRHAVGYAQQIKQWELDRDARDADGVAA